MKKPELRSKHNLHFTNEQTYMNIYAENRHKRQNILRNKYE